MTFVGYIRNIVRIFGAVRSMYGFFGGLVRIFGGLVQTSWGYFRGRTIFSMAYYSSGAYYFPGHTNFRGVLFKVIG